MKQVTVISGKGGTGKTSLVAALAVLAPRLVLADCDVDASDLHLVLAPETIKQEDFSGGSQAKIRPEACTACGKCREVCRFEAISFSGCGNNMVPKTYLVDPIACEGCGVCAYFCPAKAIDFSPVVNGEWFVSRTRCGPLVHARLGPAEENSGKLVSVVREQARRIAAAEQLDLVLIDGSPGTGCPVIASITGADLVLAVTEPTPSGLHDLKRVVDLTRHFGIPTLLCINKWDLNPDVTDEITKYADETKLPVVGRIRYTPEVTEAQIKGLAVVEYTQSEVAREIERTWEAVAGHLTGGASA